MKSKFFSEEEVPRAVVAVDPSDPDNLELVIGTMRWFGPENTYVILTGRCALDPEDVFRRAAEIRARGGNPIRDIPLEEWSIEFSGVLLEASALRFKRLLGMFGVVDHPIYHGGLATKPKVPHAVHMDDLYGFGDLSRDAVGLIRGGKRYTDDCSCLAKELSGKPFIVFLGGPATGVHLLLTEFPFLYEGMRAEFAQYASLGNVSGMKWEGRSEKAQFNVMLDAVSGKLHQEALRERSIPVHFLPTDVTRRGEIGFGVPGMIEGILRTEPGLEELSRQRREWYKAAIRTRDGEVLLTHDLATLFLYLQMVGDLPVIYEVSRAVITDFQTEGQDEGAIGLNFDVSESHLSVATRLVNRDVYIDALRESLQSHSNTPRHIVVCGSIESDAPLDETEAYHREVLETVSLHLRQGHIVHWGSHPSMQGIMRALAGKYPTQMHQYLIERFVGSSLAELPANNVHVFPTLADMRKAMLARRDVGVFLRGKQNMADTIEGFSGVLLEYLAFQIMNPSGIIERHIQLGGVAALIAAMESVSVLQGILARHERFRVQYAELLVSVGR